MDVIFSNLFGFVNNYNKKIAAYGDDKILAWRGMIDASRYP